MSLIHCVQNYILRLYDEDATWPPCTRCYDCTSPTTNWQLWADPKKIIVQPLNARRGRRRSTARAPPTIRGPGVAGVEALPGRLSAVSGPGVRGCGRPSAVEEQNTPPLPTCATTPSPQKARLFATRGMPIVRHARHILSPGLTREQLAWSTAL